ncbi:MAG: hypothetical protein ACFCUV_24165 [Rivularia sp. (in: cyanobacteria)]
MNQELVIQDLAIFVVAKNHKSHLVNIDFLECSGTIPSNWELARQPVNTDNVSQVVFTNGIAITAEPQRVIFAQSIRNVEEESILIPEIAQKYASALPLMEFKAVVVNLRSYVPFEEQDTARQYITQNLLSPGAWQSVGEAPVRASVEFTYKLQRCPFHLKVMEAALQAENQSQEITPIIMFSGSFSYSLNAENKNDLLASLHSAINNWQSDLDEYQSIINNKFLAQVPQQTLPTSEYNLETSNNTETNSLFAMSA